MDNELPPVWVRRFAAGTLFGSGVLVGICFYDAFVVQPKYERIRKANRELYSALGRTEMRLVYLAVMLADNEITLDDFDIYALTYPM